MPITRCFRPSSLIKSLEVLLVLDSIGNHKTDTIGCSRCLQRHAVQEVSKSQKLRGHSLTVAAAAFLFAATRARAVLRSRPQQRTLLTCSKACCGLRLGHRIRTNSCGTRLRTTMVLRRSCNGLPCKDFPIESPYKTHLPHGTPRDNTGRVPVQRDRCDHRTCNVALAASQRKVDWV